MCDVLLGVPGMCDKVWQGGWGSKLAKNSVTHFMDGPIECLFVCLFVHPHENRSGSILVCLFCLHTCLFESGPFSFQFISQLSFEYSFIKSSFWWRQKRRRHQQLHACCQTVTNDFDDSRSNNDNNSSSSRNSSRSNNSNSSTATSNIGRMWYELGFLESPTSPMRKIMEPNIIYTWHFKVSLTT